MQLCSGYGWTVNSFINLIEISGENQFINIRLIDFYYYYEIWYMSVLVGSLKQLQ